VHALSNVSLTLDDSRVYALVGESGSGKTTLAKLLLGLDAPDSGTIVFNEQPVWDDAERIYHRKGFQIVFQNPFASLNPRWKIYDVLAEGLWLRKEKRADVDEKVRSILAEVELPEDVLSKFPHQLSGGQRQRIAIARALLVEPDVLILDEPVSSLDVTIQSQILDLIGNIAHKRTMIALYISHDLASVRRLASYIYILREGKLVEEGAVETIYTSPAHEYTRSLLASFYGEDMNEKV